jgi:hypothetical protein
MYFNVQPQVALSPILSPLCHAPTVSRQYSKRLSGSTPACELPLNLQQPNSPPFAMHRDCQRTSLLL